MGDTRRYAVAFVLSLVTATLLLTQIQISATRDLPDLGTFLYIDRSNETRSQVKILDKPQYIRTELQTLVLEDRKWKLQVYVSATLKTTYEADVTYYKEGIPTSKRKESIVSGFFPQFDIEYLDKTSKERTRVRRYLVSEFLEGLDSRNYLAAAKKNEETNPPVSVYSVGRIQIINRQTTVTGRRFDYKPEKDLYEEKIDVEILFDIKCVAQVETRMSLMDCLNETTGGVYNTLTLIMGVLTLGLLFIRTLRHSS